MTTSTKLRHIERDSTHDIEQVYMQEALQKMEQLGFETFHFILINGSKQHFQPKYLHGGFLGGHRAAKDLRSETISFLETEHLYLQGSVTIIYYYGNFEDLTHSFAGSSPAEQVSSFREFQAGFQAVMPKVRAFIAQLDTRSTIERGYLESLVKMIASDSRCHQVVLSGFNYDQCLEFRSFRGLSFNESAKFKMAGFTQAFIDIRKSTHKRTISQILQNTMRQMSQQQHMSAESFPEVSVHRPPPIRVAEAPTSLPTSLRTSTTMTALSPRPVSPPDPSATRNPVYRANRRENAHINASFPQQSCARRETPINSFSPIQRDRFNRRLDSVLEPVPPTLIENMENVRFCNKYHLKGFCSFQKCKHRHKVVDGRTGMLRELSEVEVRALRILARRSPCRFGTSCNDPGCFAGHWCTNHTVKAGKECSFPEEMHYVRTEPVTRPTAMRAP